MSTVALSPGNKPRFYCRNKSSDDAEQRVSYDSIVWGLELMVGSDLVVSKSDAPSSYFTIVV